MSGARRFDLLTGAYAHRGLWGGEVPENSLAAFRAAAHAGVGCELDVRLTRDGELVVFHDPTLARMCGRENRVDSIDLAMLRKIPLPDSSTIPTLAEALTAMDGQPVLVELKIEDPNTAIAERVAAVLDIHEGPAAAMSFDEATVARLREHISGHLVGQLIERESSVGGDEIAAKAQRAHALGVDYLAPHLSSLKQVGNAAIGLPLVTWTVRTSSDLASARKFSAAPIFEKISADLAMTARNSI